MAEFDKKTNLESKGPGNHGVEGLITGQAGFVANEPLFFTFLHIVMDKLNHGNPLTAALFALALYRELRMKQDASDKLSKETD
tara:strand:- start:552 stop:800 length:249 start_codon:yes stop_codon:yes gene_type:complete